MATIPRCAASAANVRPVRPSDVSYLGDRTAGRHLRWVVNVFQFFQHGDVDVVTLPDGNDANRSAAADRLQRRVRQFKVGRRVPPPGLERRRARQVMGFDLSFGYHSADRLHSAFEVDLEIIVDRVDQLIPKELAIDSGDAHRVCRGCPVGCGGPEAARRRPPSTAAKDWPDCRVMAAAAAANAVAKER